tara:strand:- start:182 stop:1087 length:906 start_codon:yes stop_codon:yes gene_type:complete
MTKLIGNVKVEPVTPSYAKMLLEKNTCNYRKLNNKTVNEYTNKMLKGEWNSACCLIQVDKNGKLVNGQHRLHAIVKGGVTVDVILVTDVLPESRYLIDAHMPRRMKDHCECMPYKITMINTFLRSERLHLIYKDNVPFFKKHVKGIIGKLSEKMHLEYGNTTSPFTSVGLRAGLILGVINNDITEEEALDLFVRLKEFRRKPKSKGASVGEHYNDISTRSKLLPTFDPLMQTLINYLDADKLPVQTTTSDSNSWYTESYEGAREKASKIMKATYLAISNITKQDEEYKGTFTKQIREALGV